MTFTLRGTSRRTRSTPDIYHIPNREASDDGLAVEAKCGPECDHTDGRCEQIRPVCPDCGRGRLLWAEAGFVPWHRICDRCGSHFSVSGHPQIINGILERSVRITRAQFQR